MKEIASAGVEGYNEAAVVLQQVRAPVRGKTVHILHCIGVALELHYSAVHNSARTVMTQATCAVLSLARYLCLFSDRPALGNVVNVGRTSA